MRRPRGLPGIGAAVWAGALVRTAQWDRRLRSPQALRALQLETLRSHCRRAAHTAFGRQHDLGGVRSHADFVSRVPLRTYADFEPYFLRMRAGARDVLWPGFVEHFSSSSGTTATSAAPQKLLPVSRDQIAWQRRAGADVLMRYLALTGDRRLFGGYTIHLFPPAVVTQDGPVKRTTNPALMRLALPRAAQRRSLPTAPLRDVADYDVKLDAIAEAYLDHDVRGVSGTTCWFSLLFDRVLGAARKRGRPADRVADVWPNLRVLFGGGVSTSPYRRLIDTQMGSTPVLMDSYNATEGGILAATDRLDEPGMAVFVDRGVFYELVERGEEGRPGARRVPLWEAEPGGEYAVNVTTSSGLFGYALGDYVRVTSVYPHRIEFTGRVSGVLSLTQERTTYSDVEIAVAAAQATQPCTIVDFAAAPEFGVGPRSQGRYVLYVEFDRAPEDQAAFLATFDQQLGARNNMYREYRDNDVAIVAPRLVALPRGGSRELMHRLGQTSPQCKFPRIVDERRSAILESLARPGMETT